jgi:predicted porin
MQKKLIALAVAGMASTAAFAQSNVTIYGLIQPSYDFIDTGASKDTTRLSDNNSRIGFKGEEALGNGLKAIFQVESGVSVGGSADGAPQGGVFGGRDTFVGLSTANFGSLTFGKHQDAYKKSADWADPFADTIADYNNIMGAFGFGEDQFNKRHAGSAYYTSPTWGGFNLLASYALRDQGDGDTGVSTNATQADNTYSLAGTYKWGGLNLLAAYIERGLVGTSDELTGWKLGAGYKFSFGTKLNGIYEQADQGDWENGRFYISATQPLTSNLDLNAAYIQADGSRHLGGDSKNYSLGVDYKLSKRTSVQGIYTHLKNGDNGSNGLDAGYIATNSDGEVTGQKVSGFSVRLRHAF